MLLLLERTEKFICNNEAEVEKLIEDSKESAEFSLIDYKVSEKTSKELVYYIVTLKKKYLTLEEGKDQI